MITLHGLDHVVFRTTQLSKMLHFYIDILGCIKERELGGQGLTQLRAGSALIDIVTVDSELGRLGGGPPMQNGRNVDHVCLLISPVNEEELIRFFSENQILCSEFSERYGAQGYGHSIYVHDPEGNVIELKPIK